MDTAASGRVDHGAADVLEIRLLGGFEIRHGSAILSLPATPKSRSLLAYLVLNRGRLANRETICAALWPDEAEPVARKALRSALWRVRSALGASGGRDDLVYCDAYQVGFRSATLIWADVWEFEAAIAAAEFKSDELLCAADGEVLTRAALLYRGNCAAGVHDEWIATEQIRLHQAYVALLERIARLHASQRRFRQAIGWAERALVADPLREHLHRIVISGHLSLGDRPSALRQLALCKATLRSELGIEPMSETLALMKDAEVKAGAPADPRQSMAVPFGLAAEPDSATANDRRVVRHLGGARGQRPIAQGRAK